MGLAIARTGARAGKTLGAGLRPAATSWLLLLGLVMPPAAAQSALRLYGNRRRREELTWDIQARASELGVPEPPAPSELGGLVLAALGFAFWIAAAVGVTLLELWSISGCGLSSASLPLRLSARPTQ